MSNPDEPPLAPRRRLFRPWLPGVVCLVCGVSGVLVFLLTTTPNSRVMHVYEMCIVAPFFGAALILLALDWLHGSRESWSGRVWQDYGCGVLLVLALVSLVAVVMLGPP